MMQELFHWSMSSVSDQTFNISTESLNHVVAVGLMSRHLILSWYKRLSVTAATWWNNASHVRTHWHTHLLLSCCNETCEYKRSTAPCVCVCVCNAADSITATCVLIIPGFIECVWGVRRLSFYSETNTTELSPTVINTRTHTLKERERERVVVCVFCLMTKSPVVVSFVPVTLLFVIPR